jgi:hypothetical protein
MLGVPMHTKPPIARFATGERVSGGSVIAVVRPSNEGSIFMTLTLELDEQQVQRLQDAARRLNVSVNDLAKAAINDLLAKSDDDFDRAATRVLNKNAELYRRLA